MAVLMGKKNDPILKLTQDHLLGNYRRYPITLVKGKGLSVWDSSGKKYLDFVAGIAVDNLGHCHPEIVKAIRKQAGELLHVSNLYHIEPQARLARELTRHSFADKAFFCNSGTEANEAAIKMARKLFQDQGKTRQYEIITTLRSFHGRTLGALSATGQDKMRNGFGPLLPGFRYVPFNDMNALERAITPNTCAVMVEPIQGETGVNIPNPGYLKGLRGLCDRRKILLILDEVQTGMGRTGRLFAHEHDGIAPDIMTLAKGLGGGVPIGAVLATDKAAKALGPGTHGATFGGNPLVCAAALAALKIIRPKSFLNQVEKTGAYFEDRLKELGQSTGVIREIRRRGLMIGIDLPLSTPEIAVKCMEQGILINAIAPNTIRFVPPLIVGKKEIDRLIRILGTLLKKELTQS